MSAGWFIYLFIFHFCHVLHCVFVLLGFMDSTWETQGRAASYVARMFTNLREALYHCRTSSVGSPLKSCRHTHPHTSHHIWSNDILQWLLWHFFSSEHIAHYSSGWILSTEMKILFGLFFQVLSRPVSPLWSPLGQTFSRDWVRE